MGACALLRLGSLLEFGWPEEVCSSRLFYHLFSSRAFFIPCCVACSWLLAYCIVVAVSIVFFETILGEVTNYYTESTFDEVFALFCNMSIFYALEALGYLAFSFEYLIVMQFTLKE
jgi:hypothetical protein